MFEATREQENVIEAMAERYGSARVQPCGDRCIVTGIDGDGVEHSVVEVDPNGVSVPAEHKRAEVVTVLRPAVGFTVIGDRGAVQHYATEADVGRRLLTDLDDATRSRVRARTSLTQERALTREEQERIVAAAMAVAAPVLAINQGGM